MAENSTVTRAKRKRRPAVTMTLRGAAAHRFLRAFDPTFPDHPDEKSEQAAPATREATRG